jgi:hypothetical protein
MSHGVELLSLAIQDVDGLDRRVDLGPFGGCLSVISGRSRAARATLVTALRAALFERHDARHEGINVLQGPESRGVPEIWVELALAGERMSVHKRFLERPLAEVSSSRDGLVFTGAAAEEALTARLAGHAGVARSEARSWGLLRSTPDPGPPGDPATQAEDPIAEILDLAAQHAEAIAELDAIGPRLPALEGAWKAALVAEARAHDLERRAQESEFDLANAEALLDAVHCERAARASLSHELEALDGAIEGVDAAVLPGTRARREAIVATLSAQRRLASDALLEARHASALLALAPAHRCARSAADALDEVTPGLLRGETLHARAAITTAAKRVSELRAAALALRAWRDEAPRGPGIAALSDRSREHLAAVVRLSAARMIADGNRPLPLFIDDTPGWSDDGRLLSMLQILRETPSAPQIIVLTAHPARFARLDVKYAVDLDLPCDTRRRAPGLDRISR